MSEWFDVVRKRPVRARFLGPEGQPAVDGQLHVSGYLVEVQPGMCRHFTEADFIAEWRSADTMPDPQQVSAAVLQLASTIVSMHAGNLVDDLTKLAQQHIHGIRSVLDGMASKARGPQQPAAPAVEQP
jgi:hypothetical protein